MAVERLQSCDNIVALSQELGVHRRLLYQWRDQSEAFESAESPPGSSRESTLRKEISQLQRVLAEKTLEVDFFKGALQKVEARRRNSGMTGEKASTTKSRSDALARQLKHRAHVSTGGSESSGVLSFSARAGAGGGRDGNALSDQEIAVEHRRRYGYRRITAELRRRGMRVNHKRVLRILREDNLLGVQPRAFVVDHGYRARAWRSI